jgi:effector-binding domain-containing protein
MFKNIFYATVIIILIFIGAGLFLPGTVHVERSVDINRPASTIFTLVNGFETFSSWSPWAARDPSATYQLSGPLNGVGARLDWQGDPRLSGTGFQEIIASTPWSGVRCRLNFDQQGEAVTEFSITAKEKGAALTWEFDADLTAGQNLAGSLIARYFGLLFDRWIGSDFEIGLGRLKALAESLPNVDFSDLDIEILDVPPVDILYIQSGTSQDAADIAEMLASSYRELTDFINQNDMTIAAQPMAVTHAGNRNGYAFDAAIPVVMKTVELTGRVQSGTTPGGRAVRVVHRGPYEQMIPTYEKISAYMGAHGLREGPVSWEQYISDPGQTRSEDLVTHIYFLIGP